MVLLSFRLVVVETVRWCPEAEILAARALRASPAPARRLVAQAKGVGVLPILLEAAQVLARELGRPR